MSLYHVAKIYKGTPTICINAAGERSSGNCSRDLFKDVYIIFALPRPGSPRVECTSERKSAKQEGGASRWIAFWTISVQHTWTGARSGNMVRIFSYLEQSVFKPNRTVTIVLSLAACYIRKYYKPRWVNSDFLSSNQ